MADANIAEKLHARAMGYSHPAVKIMKSSGWPLTVAYTQYYPPDAQACLFWLRNRRPQNWREKIDHARRVDRRRSSARRCRDRRHSPGNRTIADAVAACSFFWSSA
jgi:hypothetical protein